MSDSSILGEMRRLVRDAVADAYIEGLAEGGIPADEMGDDDAVMIVELAQTQLEHVTDFVRAIRAAKGDKAAQRDILDSRVAMWTASIEAAGQAGLASAKANEMVVFAVKPGADPSDESCKTCVRLLGQKHRRKWVIAHGLIPAPGNDKFECGAWRCPHAWMPVSTRAKEYDPNQPRDELGRWTEGAGGGGGGSISSGTSYDAALSSYAETTDQPGIHSRLLQAANENPEEVRQIQNKLAEDGYVGKDGMVIAWRYSHAEPDMPITENPAMSMSLDSPDKVTHDMLRGYPYAYEVSVPLKGVIAYHDATPELFSTFGRGQNEIIVRSELARRTGRARVRNYFGGKPYRDMEVDPLRATDGAE